MSVVLYHYTAKPGMDYLISGLTKYGYLGVPVFFMISGYVISMSASKRTAMEFVISRFVRLYPTYWCGIGVTLLVAMVLGEGNYSLLQVVTNLTMLNDYFDIENIDDIYWTLQVELKFYGCVFILLMLGVFDRFKLWLVPWTALTTIHLLTNQPGFMGWFISPGYSPFFIAGIVYYRIHSEGMTWPNVAILCVAFVLSMIRVFQQTHGFIEGISIADQFISAIIIAASFGLFLAITTEKVQLAKRNVYVVLGGLTYPLYLVHNTAGKAIIDACKSAVSEAAAIGFTLALMLFISWLIYNYMEKRYSGKLKSYLLRLQSGTITA
jgi:peptidoglycan/LPS O-acetylase OafA/YrhL